MDHGRSNGQGLADDASSLERPSGPMRAMFAFGRFVGFVLFAGPALLIVAAIVLLPAYQKMQMVAHERDCERQRIESYQQHIRKQQELLSRAPEDAQVTRVAAMEMLRLSPRNEVVVEDPTMPKIAVGTIFVTPQAQPDLPSGWLVDMAGKIQDPATRRGLFLLAAVAMLAAVFLFAPPGSYRRKSAEEDAAG